MGKSQRTKGATYEREVRDAFNAALGTTAQRNIGQARDGGEDLFIPPFVLEAKRRKSLKTLMGWYEQARQASARKKGGPYYPIVVARQDNDQSVVVIGLADFLHILYVRQVWDAIK